jgi:hypothetical protein
MTATLVRRPRRGQHRDGRKQSHGLVQVVEQQAPSAPPVVLAALPFARGHRERDGEAEVFRLPGDLLGAAAVGADAAPPLRSAYRFTSP